MDLKTATQVKEKLGEGFDSVNLLSPLFLRGPSAIYDINKELKEMI